VNLETILSIIESDTGGLINLDEKRSSNSTDSDRLISSFEEINSFYDEHQRAPQLDSTNMDEFLLAKNLEGIQNSEDKMSAVSEYDRNSLLKPSTKAVEVNSIDDILDSDPLGLLGLDDDVSSIFTEEHISFAPTDRIDTDFVARRKPCKDFDKYEPLFKQVQAEIKSGSRKIIDFKAQSLVAGNFYIDKGVLFLLKEVDIDRKDHYREDGTRVRTDGRTHCIFENGTESNMLFRSVEKNLYKDGKIVTTPKHQIPNEIITKLTITDSDIPTGYIYILKSLSKKPEIQSIPNLYKIGYTEQSVEDRIRGAENQSTYLMAPVHIVSTFKCYNLKTTKLESLLHNFFGSACIDITVVDSNGEVRHPKEWFSVPLDVIETAIEMILDGTIVNFYFSSESNKIIPKS